MRLGTLVVALAIAGVVVRAHAAPPTHHGKLKLPLHPGRGHVNVNTGNATFSVRSWILTPAGDTNGIDPETEGLIIAVGDSENFVLPAGQLKMSKNGKRFTYRSKTERGIRFVRLARDAEGNYTVRFTVAGADFSRLVLLPRPASDCLPFAIIIGDDDGFSGVKFQLPRLSPLSGLLVIPGFCDDIPGWPWA